MTGVGSTAAISIGTSSTVAVLHWGFQCVAAHSVVTPDETTLIILAGFVAPLVHAARDWLVARLGGEHA